MTQGEWNVGMHSWMYICRSRYCSIGDVFYYNFSNTIVAWILSPPPNPVLWAEAVVIVWNLYPFAAWLLITCSNCVRFPELVLINYNWNYVFLNYHYFRTETKLLSSISHFSAVPESPYQEQYWPYLLHKRWGTGNNPDVSEWEWSYGN